MHSIEYSLNDFPETETACSCFIKQKPKWKRNLLLFKKYLMRHKLALLEIMLAQITGTNLISQANFVQKQFGVHTLLKFSQIFKLSNYLNCLQSVTKIMGKTAIRTISCFYPLPRLNKILETMSKTCVQLCYGFATLYRERGRIFKYTF